MWSRLLALALLLLPAPALAGVMDKIAALAPQGVVLVMDAQGGQSRTLSEILVELLRASNNYIANQVWQPRTLTR